MMKELNYDSLIIDKENESVYYNDLTHKYWTKDSKETCISVTTLIHKFQTFDEKFWSAYKAIEKILGEDFNIVKGELLDKKIFNIDILEKVNIDGDTFDEVRKSILKEWEEKREVSCIRGSAIHKELELGHLSGKTTEIKKLGLGGKFDTNTSNLIIPGIQAVYPELLLSHVSKDKSIRLAGQADLVIIDGFDVYILDYKTSKKIELKSFYDRKTKKSQMMRYPLNNLQDTNFWHYSLQLSTYAWMIKKIDPRFNIKALMLIHYDHDGNCTDYMCDYLESDVIRMLKFYKKELEHDKFKQSRQKVNY